MENINQKTAILQGDSVNFFFLFICNDVSLCYLCASKIHLFPRDGELMNE